MARNANSLDTGFERTAFAFAHFPEHQKCSAIETERVLLGLMMLSSIGLYGLALVSAGSLLVVEDPPAQADVIVVLGGDGPPRAAQAAKLWHEEGRRSFW